MTSDFIWPFLRPYMGVIPNLKMVFIFPISCILALIFPIVIKYFTKCEGKGSFLKSQIKSLMTCIFTPDATFTTSTPLPTLSPVLSTRHRHIIFSCHIQCRTQGGGGLRDTSPPPEVVSTMKKHTLITAEKIKMWTLGFGWAHTGLRVSSPPPPHTQPLCVQP